MTYSADAKRYEKMPYNYCGKSGLKLPKLSAALRRLTSAEMIASVDDRYRCK